MVYESGDTAHESCIYSAFRRAEVIESQIYTQTFSKEVHARLNQLSCVDFNQLVFEDFLTCKKTQPSSWYRRSSDLDLLESSLSDTFVFAFLISVAAFAEIGIAFLLLHSTWTLFPAALPLALTSRFPKRAVWTAQTLWHTKPSLVAAAILANCVPRLLPHKIMAASGQLLGSGLMRNLELLLVLLDHWFGSNLPLSLTFQQFLLTSIKFPL